MLHRIVSLLAGGPYGLRSVHLPHEAPPAPERFREFFGAEVRFDRPAAVLRVPGDLLRRPVAGGDETVRAIAIEYLETHFARPGRTVTDRVRAAVDRSLGTGPVRIGSVARLLRVHPRTLQRHLAAEGTTFEAVVDEARRDTAERLILRTDLPFTQVAAMVGWPSSPRCRGRRGAGSASRPRPAPGRPGRAAGAPGAGSPRVTLTDRVAGCRPRSPDGGPDEGATTQCFGPRSVSGPDRPRRLL